MRINTDGNYEWRKDVYSGVQDLLNEGSKSRAIDSAVLFTKEMIPNLERALEHPDMTEELAAVLSTSEMELEYEVRSSVNVNGDGDD